MECEMKTLVTIKEMRVPQRNYTHAQRARVIGMSVKIATFEEAKEATGVEPGAVCPILLRVQLLVDRRVLAKERINFGSGHHLYGLEIDPRDLERIVEYRQVDIAEAH